MTANLTVHAALTAGLVFCACLGGCSPSPSAQTAGPVPAPLTDSLLVFAPARITIAPWTEIRNEQNQAGTLHIHTFVRLTDAYGSDIKAPGTLRFELYERLPRSVEARGKRLVLWPDYDLNGAQQNNVYWRDFLRAYEFNLDLEPANGGPYILEATFIPPEGRRLTAQHSLPGAK